MEEFRSFVAKREAFAFESTLSGRTYIGLLKNAQQRGFRVYLHYLWLPTPAIAKSARGLAHSKTLRAIRKS